MEKIPVRDLPAGACGRGEFIQTLKSSYVTWLSGTPSLVSSSRAALSIAGGPHRLGQDLMDLEQAIVGDFVNEPTQ